MAAAAQHHAFGVDNPVPPSPAKQKKKRRHPYALARVSLVCLAAPADGVAPSLLLSVQDAGGRQLGQYLFNAPEGLSRLMLEHKARPERCLRALFLSGTSPAEAGGLGGLVLRLKQDGHATLQLVGPQGACRGGWRGCGAWLLVALLCVCVLHAVQAVLQRHTVSCMQSRQPCTANLALPVGTQAHTTAWWA
jgi:hypothetical protein